jgi:hypothetical protein
MSGKLCQTNTDCNTGYACKASVECNDFGCSAPTNECTPSDDGPTQITTSTDSEQERVQTATNTQAKTSSKSKQESASVSGSNASVSGSSASVSGSTGSASTSNGSVSASTASVSATSTSVRPSRLIIRTQNTQDSILRFESSNNDFGYEFRLNPETKNFNLYNGAKSVMGFNSDGTEINCNNDVTLKISAIEVQNLWTIGGGQLSYTGVPQWKLVHDEVFRVGQMADGWSIPDAVTQCGAVHMLGGYCKTSNENLIKTFDNLPPHDRIKIEANYHFLDSWGGDTAFMKVSTSEDLSAMNYAWTDSYDYISSRNAINV